jgi:hypothetical protein
MAFRPVIDEEVSPAIALGCSQGQWWIELQNHFGIGTEASGAFVGLVPPGLAVPEAEGFTVPCPP